MMHPITTAVQLTEMEQQVAQPDQTPQQPANAAKNGYMLNLFLGDDSDYGDSDPLQLLHRIQNLVSEESAEYQALVVTALRAVADELEMADMQRRAGK